MKKYRVKQKWNGDIFGEYNSRKEASDILMEYIYYFNDCSEGEYLSPFDYELEEVECKEVNEVITDFESAKKYLVGNANDVFGVAKKRISKSIDPIKDAETLIKELNPKHIEALVTLNRLFTVEEAWNKADGFVPDFSDSEQKSGFLGSNMTRILRGSCLRIRVTRPRMRVRVSALVFASNRPRAPRNSAINSPTFTTRFSFNK